jgi:arylsulfatase A-like enzyme
MTDDQTMADLRVMPRTRALIGDRGVTFDRFFVTYSVCAPSRATYLSGQYAHNNEVMSLGPPDGGFGRFDGKDSLPVWMRDAGYQTAHIGKYINGYGDDPRDATTPPGWDDWYGLVGQSTYRMWGYTLDHDGVDRTIGRRMGGSAAQYQTNVLTRIATRVIRRHAGARQPLFLSVAYVAPHHERLGLVRRTGRLIRPAPRDARWRLRPEPRGPDFNERDVSDKPRYVRRLLPLGRRQIQQIDANIRDRQASLQAVDRGVAAIVGELRRTGQLRDTYIVFTSDNGFMTGQHRIAAGKLVPYDASTRVPLLIRGPGVPAGAHSKAIAGNVNLAPTILALAGANAGLAQDGTSLVPLLRHPARRPRRAILLESGGLQEVQGVLAADGKPEVQRLLTFRGVRTNRWLYVRYRNGDHELYDLASDPFELDNRARDPRYADTERALDALTTRLASCRGPDCRATPRIPGPSRPGAGGSRWRRSNFSRLAASQ